MYLVEDFDLLNILNLSPCHCNFYLIWLRDKNVSDPPTTCGSSIVEVICTKLRYLLLLLVVQTIGLLLLSACHSKVSSLLSLFCRMYHLLIRRLGPSAIPLLFLGTYKSNDAVVVLVLPYDTPTHFHIICLIKLYQSSLNCVICVISQRFFVLVLAHLF